MCYLGSFSEDGFRCFIFLVLRCSVPQYPLAINYHSSADALHSCAPLCTELKQLLVTRCRLPYCFQPGRQQSKVSSFLVLHFKDTEDATSGDVLVSINGGRLAYTSPAVAKILSTTHCLCAVKYHKMDNFFFHCKRESARKRMSSLNTLFITLWSLRAIGYDGCLSPCLPDFLLNL